MRTRTLGIIDYKLEAKVGLKTMCWKRCRRIYWRRGKPARTLSRGFHHRLTGSRNIPSLVLDRIWLVLDVVQRG